MEIQNQLLVHAVKAIAYRFSKATMGSKADFGNFAISTPARTPNEIIRHMFDLAVKSRSLLTEGHFNVAYPNALDFEGERERLLRGLEDLATVLQLRAIDVDTSKKLLQGPILDMTTHVGQIAMLNGLHGNKIPGESYYDSVVE
ncbi:hypothetical protein FRZ67_18940 [Panacibacter ginsenosidivorans]|uniref:DinB family protein n=1 Tax=Panacibacter ginsenosidivorans TaxID=1813871 RepID=A0A5B8VE21_9BACT|nr:hypothetical protein [Panacibacter ginsenosidivorans]QEC69285.1 hypothetical protein FRZ67_18940 [Panacibacter ginsenosidivorans]